VRQKFIFLIFIFFVTKAVVAQYKIVLPQTKYIYKTIAATKPKAAPVKPHISITNIAPNFYCSNLAFFCKQEIKLEKAIKIPFKFRLGSVQMVDYLERKPNTFFIQR
jgi:hypothetical protein